MRTVHLLTASLFVTTSLVAMPALAEHEEKQKVETRAESKKEEGKGEEKTTAFKDAMLSAKVRMALLRQLKGEGLRVKVNVDGQRVMLAGFVKNRASQKLATEVVKSVEGVGKVRNNIKVKRDDDQLDEGGASDGTVANGLLESQVKVDLMQAIGDDALKLDVEAADGVVSLRGKVADADRRDRAVRSARSVDGVKEVKNLIDVDTNEDVKTGEDAADKAEKKAGKAKKKAEKKADKAEDKADKAEDKAEQKAEDATK